MLGKLWLHLKRYKFKYITLAVLVSAIIFAKEVLIDIVYIEKQYEKNRIITPWGEKIKSGNLSVDYSIEQALTDIERLGLNTVNVPVQIDIPSLTANAAVINEESQKKAIELIKKLRLRGINIS